MSKKYSELEQHISPGSHLQNLDDETWDELTDFLTSDEGIVKLAAFRKSQNHRKSEEIYEDQKLIEYLPESSREHEVISKWLSLMEDKEKGLIPIDKTKNINLCGDLELDSEVASILLDTVKTRLPNFHCRHNDGTEVHWRSIQGLKKRKIQLFPLHLFTINWATSGPGIEWPESYSVTYVPSHNVRIVTASADSDDMWGCTDLAIGWCKPYRTPDFGVKKIIQTWWKNIHVSLGHPWADVYSEGLVDVERAEKWGLEVYGSRANYDFY